MDFLRYELRGIDYPAVLRDQKQGFCLDDEAWFVPGTWCARDEPARTTMELGLVPGGATSIGPTSRARRSLSTPPALLPGATC